MTALDPSARAPGTGLTAHEWRWARERAEEGFPARSIARRLDVAHSSILRAAARSGWDVAWGREQEVDATTAEEVEGNDDAADADLHVSELQDEREPVNAPAAPQIATDEPLGERQHEAGAQGREREAWGPPEDEASARLWHCRRCGLSGFDPNRRGREWHTREVCDARLARLDRGLDDRPRPLDLRTVRF